MNHHKLSPGTTQVERLIRALSPDSFQLDDRRWQDFITTTHAYAKWLTYYDQFDTPVGDWAGFWETESLTFLAVVAALDTEQIRRGYEEIEIELAEVTEQYLDPDNLGCTEDPWPDYCLRLIEYIRTTARDIEKTYYKLRNLRHPLAETLLNLIKKDNDCDFEELKGALQKLISFNKAADQYLADCQYNMFYEVDLAQADASRWGVIGLAQYHFIPAFGRLPEQEELRELFILYFKTFQVLKSRAQADFGQELAKLEKPEDQLYRAVQPHIALYLTFLNLFRHLQEEINAVPGKHLRYYYEDVLGIARKPAKPDVAYLIFTLAKGVHDEILEKGTLFIGGKDKNGKPLYYESLEDWRLTQAKVEEVLNTYIGAEYIKAAQVVKDGSPVNPEPFRLFGDDWYNPEGQMGFGIASPQLLMREGMRNLAIDLVLEGPIRNANQFNLGDFSVRYSVEDGFYTLGKGAENQTGFVIQPKVAPFLPIITVEASRRLVNELIAESVFQTGTSSNPEIDKIFKRDFTNNSYLNDNLFYSAISGVYYTSQFIIQEKKIFEDSNSSSEEIKEAAKALVDLYFFRAYYYWTLASTYAPAYTPIDPSVPNNPNEAVATLIPDLTELFPDSGPIRFFSLEELFQQIEQDLRGDTNSALNNWEESGTMDNPQAKTSIQGYTIKALFAKILFAKGAFDDCKKLINSTDFKTAYPIQAQSSPESPFNSINSDPEVIWALETAQSETQISGFSYLGYNDSFNRTSSNRFFATASGLETVFNLDNAVTDDGGVQTTFSDSRKNNLFTSVLPLNPPDPDPALQSFSTKYFRNGQSQVIVFRSSEFMLMEAYCSLKLWNQNSTPVEIDEIRTNTFSILNKLRKRAGLPEYGLTTNATNVGFPDNQPNAEKAVVQEFFREMAFEGLRLDWLRANRIQIDDNRVPALGQPNFAMITPPVFANDDATKQKIISENPKSILSVNINILEDAPPLVPNKKLMESGISTYPAVYITFAGKTETVSGFYNFLIKQTLDKATIKVKVSNIQKNLFFQSDFGIFDGTQRFYPFGAVPENGAQFYIACDEAFNKKLSSATIKFNWIQDANINLSKIYSAGDPASYPGYPSFSFDPKVKFDILKDGVFSQVGDPFDLNSGGDMLPTISLSNVTNERYKNIEGNKKYEPTRSRGFARIVLINDFGHKVYPNILTAATIQASQNKLMNGTAIPTGTNMVNILPKSPYTPSTNNISLDYNSEQVMEWSTVLNGTETGIDHFFHLLPFEGIRKYDFNTYEKNKPNKPALVYNFDMPPELPKDPDDVIAGKEKTGGNFYPSAVYIGLSALKAGDALSLLFQAAEGSEQAPDDETPEIRWSYLRANNDWEAVKAEHILYDSTFGLTQSGIIRIAIQDDISSEGNTMLNSALVWLRASLKETEGKLANALPAFTAINAQAIEVQFLNQGNQLDHLAQPLPEGSISKLAFSRSVVKSVIQPLPSSDGRLPEALGSEFFRRVSERLRHKDRAVAPGDFERLVLDRYRSVLTAKAIAHTRYEKRIEKCAPGHVTVAIIPKLRLKPRSSRVSPRMPLGWLIEIENYLKEKSNLHLFRKEPVSRLQVMNPLYDRVVIKAKIKFIEGDFNLFKTRTAQALDRFIAPWIDDVDQYPTFGRCIYRSQLVALLENLYFVKYIKDLEIYVEREEKNKFGIGSGKDKPDENFRIEPTTARSILTTGLNHIIIPPDPNDNALPVLEILPIKLPENTGLGNSLNTDGSNPSKPTKGMQIAETQPPSAPPFPISSEPIPAPEAPVLKPERPNIPRPKPKPGEEEDDLTLIEGIGPKVQAALKAAGIKTYKALSRTSSKKIRDILKANSPRFIVPDPTSWPKQAELAASGKIEELNLLKADIRNKRL